MNTQTDLEGIEKRAYESIWDDGLIDIFVGISLLGLGIFWLTDYAVFGGFLPVLLIPIWPRVRSRITAPRVGSVQFSADRRATERRNLTGLFLGGSLTLVLGVVLYAVVRGGTMDRDWLAIVIPALPGVLLAIGASITGGMIGAHRFQAYAALLLVGSGVGTWLSLRPGVYLAAAGAGILATGVMLLVRFVGKYPVEVETGQ